MDDNSGRRVHIDELDLQRRARDGAASEALIDAMASQTQSALAAVGLTHAQFVLLLAVSELEPLDAESLQRILVVGTRRAGAELRVLQEKGAVCEHTNDEARLIGTTAHGRALLQRALPLWEAAQARIRRSMRRDDPRCELVMAAKKPAVLG